MPFSQTIIYLLSVVLSLMLGFFSLTQNRRATQNQLFFWFTISQALWVVALYLGYFFAFADPPTLEHSIIFFRLAFALGISMLGLLIIFLYWFPRVTFKVPAVLKYLFLLSIVFAAGLSAFTSLIHESQYLVNGVYDDTDQFGPLYPLYNLLVAIYFLIAAFVLVKKTFQLTGVEKNKMIIASVGGWIFLFLAATTNVFLPLLGIWNVGPIDIQTLLHYSPSFALFFIVATFYSINWYRFFNFSNTSLNFVRRILLMIVFLATTIISREGLSLLFPHLPINVSLGIGAFVGIVIFVYIRKYLPELISDEYRDFRNAIIEFKSKMYFCETYEKFQKWMEDIFVIRLNFVRAGVYVIRQKRDKSLIIPVYVKNRFTDELKKYTKDVLIKDEIKFRKIVPSTKKILSSAMERLKVDLCVPLFSEKNLIGFFALNKKGGASPYSREEIRDLQGLQKHLQVCLMNLLLKMNLQEENDLMKTIIDQKTKSLRRQFDDIKKLLNQQADFIAITAHEFRTPLTIAMFQLDDVLSSGKRKPAELVKDLKVVDSSLENLKDLTHKLFDVQRYDLNKVELHKEKTDIVDFVKNIHAEFKLVLAKKKIKLSFKKNLTHPTILSFDRSKMRQVLHNLLNNAGKFTPEGGHVKLSIDGHRSYVDIAVHDNGKGISAEIKKHIFKKFKSGKHGEGIGLGLYIAKKIMELHKGKIWIEDPKEGGAMFCVRLPK